MGSVSQLLAKYSVQVRRGWVDIHRDQGIVERFNRTLAERLFGHQYAQEMRLPSGERSTEWVKRLPSVIAALSREVTWLTDKKLSDAIKAKTLTQKPSSVVPGHPLGLKVRKVPSGVGVRYLYQPGELEGGRRRATDPVWSLEVYRLGRSMTKPDEPVLYYLQGDDAHSKALFEKSCLRCHPTHSYHRMRSSGVEACVTSFFGCTRDRSAWCYHGCDQWCCLAGQDCTVVCPLAGKPRAAECCTPHSGSIGPP